MTPIYTFDLLLTLLLIIGMTPTIVADISPLLGLDLGDWAEQKRNTKQHEAGTIILSVLLGVGTLYLGGQFTFLFAMIYIPLVLIHNRFVVDEEAPELLTY